MRDCSKIPKYSGEHLSCEVQNLQIQEAYSNGFAVGGFFFFILATIIFGAITICKSHKECKEIEKSWGENHKKHMEELNKLLDEKYPLSKKGKKSGSK